MPLARPSLLFGLTLLVGCAGGTPKLVGSSILDAPDAAAPASSAAPASLAKPDAGAEGPGASQGEDAGAVPVDPDAVQAALGKSGEAGGDAPLGLHFEVVAPAPDKPWLMAIVNRGTEAALVDFDPRLLAFDIELPPPPPDEKASKNKKPAKPAKPPKPPKPHECRLPAEIAPARVEEGSLVKLEPGEGLVQNFDPRLYCPPNDTLPLLGPGAKLTPRFGWPLKTKVSWRGGKRVESVENQPPPFVAEPVEAAGSLPSQGEHGAEPASQPLAPKQAKDKASKEPAEPERRVKELRGTSFELGTEFASKPAPKISEEPLSLSVQGSDAQDEVSATLTVSLRNRSKSKLDLYFRRELVSFQVAGPDGVSTCDPEPDSRSPDRQAFSSLAPGGVLSAVSRLMEMCPAHTFARPGLYRVEARFDAASDGSQFGLHAFTGRISGQKAALVRIRRGPLPFMSGGPAQRVHVGYEKH